MPERFLLPSVDIRMFVLLGAHIRWQLSEAKMNNSLIQRDEETAPPVVEEVPSLVYAVPCRYCGSDETQPVSEEHGIYECTRCGEVFHRT